MNKKIFLIVLLVGLILLFSGFSVVGSIPGEKFNSKEIQFWKPGSKDSNDTTPPVTNISLKGKISAHGVFSSEVEVTLNATDDLSGVNVTYYDLDANGDEIYNEPFIIIEHGWHGIAYYSIDNAGNVEKLKIINFFIDLIPPEICLSFKRLYNKSIKFNSEVFDIGAVYKVEYYIDKEYKHTAYSNNNFNWIWTSPTPGYYVVKSIVYDKADNTGFDEIGLDIPRSRSVVNQWYLMFLERFPIFERLLELVN